MKTLVLVTLGVAIVAGACSSDKKASSKPAADAATAPDAPPPDGAAAPDAPASQDRPAEAAPAADAAVAADASPDQAADAGARLDVAPGDTARPDSAPDVASAPDASSGADAAAPDGGLACTPKAPSTRLTRYFQTGVALTSTQTTNFTVGKGARVSGVVTLPSPPAGGTFKTGSVAFIDRTTYQTYSVTGTMTAADTFSYQVSLPAGHYRVMTSFALGFGSGAAMSILTRRRFDKDVEICGDADYNIVLDPIGPVTTRTATITGISALGPARYQAGYIGFVTMENDSHTLSCFAVGPTVPGDSFAVMMALPDDTFIPLIQMTDTGNPASPRQSGLTSGVKLAPAPAAASYTLPLVPVVKMSGTVSDPMLQMVQPIPLSPIPGSPTGPSPVSYLHCDNTDLGTFPDPPFLYNDGATGNIFSDALAYRTFIRKGMECSLYAVLAIQLGAGGAATNLGENTYGFLELPGKMRERMVASADFTKDYTVPKTPANIQISGTVSDADGAMLASAGLEFHSTALQGAGFDTTALSVTVVADAQGHFKANLVPGTYDVTIQK